MKLFVFFLLLSLLFSATAQDFKWQQDSSGVWFIKVSAMNSFVDTATDINGDRLIFTKHEPSYSDRKNQKSHLLVSRILPSGELEVIRRLNFFSGDFVFKKFNKHYYFLAQDGLHYGSKIFNVILEYDAHWNYVRHTRVMVLKGFWRYTDFAPIDSSRFYCVSNFSRGPANLSNGSYLVKTNKKGNIEIKRLFEKSEINDLEPTKVGVCFTVSSSFNVENNGMFDSVQTCYADSSLGCIINFDTITKVNPMFESPSGDCLESSYEESGYVLRYYDKENNCLWTLNFPDTYGPNNVLPLSEGRFIAELEYYNNDSAAGPIMSETHLVVIDREMNQSIIGRWSVQTQDESHYYYGFHMYLLNPAMIEVFYHKSTYSGEHILCREVLKI